MMRNIDQKISFAEFFQFETRLHGKNDLKKRQVNLESCIGKDIIAIPFVQMRS